MSSVRSTDRSTTPLTSPQPDAKKAGARVDAPASKKEAPPTTGVKSAAVTRDGFSEKKPGTNAPGAVSGSAAGARGVSKIDPVVSAEAKTKAPQVTLRLKNPAGELGYLGPIGPSGPLGATGPVGRNAWNPSRYITGSFGWESWAQLNTMLGGPLSSLGPLGKYGPLSQQASSGVVEPLKPGGSEAVLGPAGPLGALGALGPLGPTGAHGFRANESGAYENSKGQVQRTLNVSWGLDAVKTEELFENYTEAHAKAMKDNDTSFMVEGQLEKKRDSDTYNFHSRVDQYVTVLVLPTTGAVVPDAGPAGKDSAADLAKHFDDFDLEILDTSGKVIGRSSLRDGADWLQLKVPAGADLQARVTLKGSPHAEVKPYRLFVVGTGEHTSDINGGKAWDAGSASVAARVR